MPTSPGDTGDTCGFQRAWWDAATALRMAGKIDSERVRNAEFWIQIRKYTSSVPQVGEVLSQQLVKPKEKTNKPMPWSVSYLPSNRGEVCLLGIL